MKRSLATLSPETYEERKSFFSLSGFLCSLGLRSHYGCRQEERGEMKGRRKSGKYVSTYFESNSCGSNITGWSQKGEEQVSQNLLQNYARHV
jgi:hypothetical protein